MLLSRRWQARSRVSAPHDSNPASLAFPNVTATLALPYRALRWWSRVRCVSFSFESHLTGSHAVSSMPTISARRPICSASAHGRQALGWAAARVPEPRTGVCPSRGRVPKPPKLPASVAGFILGSTTDIAACAGWAAASSMRRSGRSGATRWRICSSCLSFLRPVCRLRTCTSMTGRYVFAPEKGSEPAEKPHAACTLLATALALLLRSVNLVNPNA